MKQNVSLPSEFISVFNNTKFTRQLLQVVGWKILVAVHLQDFCAAPGIYFSTLKIIDHQLCVT